MIHRLLIATDFSAASIRAARWATACVAPHAAQVLVHAVDVPTPPGFLKALFAGDARVQDHALPEARQRLAELRDTLGLAATTTLDVRTGRPWQVLTEACDEHRPDLLVVGPHGERSGVGRLLGSTAERAIREASVPVLVANGSETARPHRVLVAVDDSLAGFRALRWAADLARALEVELVAVHVVDAALTGAVAIASAPQEEASARAALVAASQTWLHEQVADLGLPAGPVRLDVRIGHPADEVVLAAREAEADILAIGRNATEPRLTRTSIADLVLRANTAATVVVPA